MTPRTLQTSREVYKVLGIDITSLIDCWQSEYSHAVKHHGKPFAVKLMKEYLTLGERYALRQPITNLSFKKSDNNGFPSKLRPFKPWLRSKNEHRVRAALTVLRTVEDLRLPISKDISTVTDPQRIGDLSPIIAFIPQWAKRLPKLYIEDIKYHLSYKKGPNGQALKTTDMDLGAIITTELMPFIKAVSKALYDEAPPDETFLISEGGIHSRLSQFPDKSGKTRTIAVVDYYSQRALRPLQRALMDLLKKLVSDGTYSHKDVGVFAQRATKEKSFIACYDLSAATDRFPYQLQYALLKAIVPKENLSEGFWNILAKRKFFVPWSGETVSYEAGQPMGAFASWPLFSLAHHAVIEYCGRGTQGSSKHKYKMIGDDVIITDERMAQNYEKVMALCGVSINLGKTVKSGAQCENSAAEVAKMLFLNGKQLSPLTPGFVKTLVNPLMFNQTLRILVEREFITDFQLLPDLMKVLFRKDESFNKALILIQNPINGLSASHEVSIGTNRWSPFSETEVLKAFQCIRLRNLLRRVVDIDVYAFGAVNPQEVGKTLPRIQEAQVYTKTQLETQMKSAAFRLACAEPKGKDASELYGVEFLSDPSEPFGDLERRKEIKKSSLLLETLMILERDEISDLEDEIEILKSDMFEFVPM
jgi:hypothetical protein